MSESFKSAGLSTPLLEREMCSILQKKPLHFKEMYGLKFCLIVLLASHARNNELKLFYKDIGFLFKRQNYLYNSKCCI